MLWDQYVSRHSRATHSHMWGWKKVIEESFGLQTFYLIARTAERVEGILPLVWQKSVLFGNFITSLPFLNAGGPLADSRDIELGLVEYAIQVSKSVRAAHLQLRYRGEYTLDLPVDTHKVAVIRDLPSDVDKLWMSVSSNNRRKVNKALKSGLSAQAEGVEALDEFYGLFAGNMRNLGTPVYSRGLFQQVLEVFPDDSSIVMVRRGSCAIAGALLVSFRKSMEAIWMCSDWRYLQHQPNMLLYWWILRVAAERGYQQLDFGRSTRESGTHMFKKLWDTHDVQLYWANWTADGASSLNLNQNSLKYRIATSLWKHIPLSVCNLVGPQLVRSLP